MCGRFTLGITNQEIENYLTTNLEVSSMKIESTYPRYNISPGQRVISIIHDGQTLRVGELEWGFIPSFASSSFKPLINARSETIREKPSFKESFQHRRCLIVSDGYYEWQKTQNHKQPFYIKKGSGIAFMAGIYTPVQLPDGTKKFTTAIITTSANNELKAIHDRMPLFIELQNVTTWLREDPQLQNTNEPFMMHPVSTQVNSAKIDHSELIVPI